MEKLGQIFVFIKCFYGFRIRTFQLIIIQLGDIRAIESTNYSALPLCPTVLLYRKCSYVRHFLLRKYYFFFNKFLGTLTEIDKSTESYRRKMLIRIFSLALLAMKDLKVGEINKNKACEKGYQVLSLFSFLYFFRSLHFPGFKYDNQIKGFVAQMIQILKMEKLTDRWVSQLHLVAHHINR